MAVFKEELYVIEGFAKRQKQIYPDACDYGVFLSDTEKSHLREAVQELRRYCHTKPVERSEGLTGKGSKTEVFVAFELDNGRYTGIKVTIEAWTPKLKGVFVEAKTLFTIDMENYSMSKADFEAEPKLLK